MPLPAHLPLSLNNSPPPPAVTNPVAQRLRARLRFDTSPLGLSPEERRGVPLVADMDEWKGAHPDKVVLARCGEFYETSGVDAVMLVNYAGLNAMGSKIRAGCPAGNVRATLRKLVEVRPSLKNMLLA